MQVHIFAYEVCIYGTNIVEKFLPNSQCYTYKHTHQPQQQKNAPQTDCVADKVVS